MLWLSLLLPRIKNRIKMKALAWIQHYINFSNTQEQITPWSEVGSSKFDLIRDVTNVLVTSKSKEDPNKNEGTRMATTLNIDFSHSQGQITLQSRVRSG